MRNRLQHVLFVVAIHPPTPTRLERINVCLRDAKIENNVVSYTLEIDIKKTLVIPFPSHPSEDAEEDDAPNKWRWRRMTGILCTKCSSCIHFFPAAFFDFLFFSLSPGRGKRERKRVEWSILPMSRVTPFSTQTPPHGFFPSSTEKNAIKLKSFYNLSTTVGNGLWTIKFIIKKNLDCVPPCPPWPALPAGVPPVTSSSTGLPVGYLLLLPPPTTRVAPSE